MQAQKLKSRLRSTNFRTRGKDGKIYCSLVKISNDDYISNNLVDPQRPETLFQITEVRHKNSLMNDGKGNCVVCPYSSMFDNFSSLGESEKTDNICAVYCQPFKEIETDLVTVEMKKAGNSYHIKK